MSSREIVIWLDERWYDALERHIRGESLKDKLENYIDELCNNLLPDYEYEQISMEIYEERMAHDAQREADRRFAVFHVAEHGEQACFLVEQAIDILTAARSMRHYISSEDSSTDFRHYYATATDITRDEFERYTQERLENTGRVTGAFDIDFDAGTFSALNINDGWHCFALKDVRTAAYHADRRNDMSHDDRLARLSEYLQGKELPSREQQCDGNSFRTMGGLSM